MLAANFKQQANNNEVVQRDMPAVRRSGEVRVQELVRRSLCLRSTSFPRYLVGYVRNAFGWNCFLDF